MPPRSKPIAEQQRKPYELLISRSDASTRLKERCDKGQALLHEETYCSTDGGIDPISQFKRDFEIWDEFNAELLNRIFTTDELSKDYQRWAGGPMRIITRTPSHQEQIASINQQIQGKLKRLTSIIERLELIPVASSVSNQSEITEQKIQSSKVFLVHGHDESIIHETARFLEKLQLQVIVLREQPNQGRTIIEKFEDYSDVGFAVVLLTADDEGGAITDKHDSLRPRARQNVILELGYFLGKLGRNCVCALYTEGVEIPSDYTGVLYTKIDSRDGWRFELAKELKAAGFTIDMNRAI